MTTQLFFGIVPPVMFKALVVVSIVYRPFVAALNAKLPESLSIELFTGNLLDMSGIVFLVKLYLPKLSSELQVELAREFEKHNKLKFVINFR